jgi:hypothetical protein
MMRLSRDRDGRWAKEAHNETEVPEKRTDRKDIDTIIRRVFLIIYFCCRLIKTLRLLTKISLWFLCFFLFKMTVTEDPITKFTETMATCLKDQPTSCVSKVKEAFLPDNVAADYWVAFRLATSDPDVSPVLQLVFPLPFKNPLILLIAATLIGLLHFLLGYIHQFLTDIANIADRAAPRQGLRIKYGGGALVPLT